MCIKLCALSSAIDWSGWTRLDIFLHRHHLPICEFGVAFYNSQCGHLAQTFRSLLFTVVFDTCMLTFRWVTLIRLTFLKGVFFAIGSILLSSTTEVFCGLPGFVVLPSSPVCSCFLVSNGWFWLARCFGYVCDWCIQIFQPHEGLLYCNSLLFCPHVERHQQWPPNANCMTKINHVPFISFLVHQLLMR